MNKTVLAGAGGFATGCVVGYAVRQVSAAPLARQQYFATSYREGEIIASVWLLVEQGKVKTRHSIYLEAWIPIYQDMPTPVVQYMINSGLLKVVPGIDTSTEYIFGSEIHTVSDFVTLVLIP